jgi:hypothetical protein
MAEPGAPETDPPLSTLPLAFLVFGGPLYLTLRWFAAREPLLQTGPALSPGGLRRKELAVWLGGAVLSALVVLAVDGRTVAVNLTDLAVGVRQPEPSDGPEAQQAFEALETTRQAAQRGELPVARYREAREDYRRGRCGGRLVDLHVEGVEVDVLAEIALHLLAQGLHLRLHLVELRLERAGVVVQLEAEGEVLRPILAAGGRSPRAAP